MRSRVAVAIVLTLAQALYVALMLSVVFYKIYTDGVIEYVQHYTNWSWTLQIIFYTGTLPAPLIIATRTTGWPLKLQARFIALTFFPLWGIVSSVLLMVIFMLATGAEFLTTIAMVFPLTEIIIGNDAVHSLPPVSLLWWAIVYPRLLYWSINELFAVRTVRTDRLLFWALLAYQVVVGALITMLFYLAFFDPNVVYVTTTSKLVGMLVMLAALITSGSVLCCGIGCFHVGWLPLDPSFIWKDDYSAPSDRIHDE